MSPPSLVLSQAETRLPDGVQNSQRTWNARESLLVTLDDGAGRTGIGEAAPLEGYAPDTLGEAKVALEGIPGSALEAAVAAPELGKALSALPPLPPSAGFALECALAHLAARRRGRRLAVAIQELVGRPGALAPARPAAALVDLGSDLDRGLAWARQAGAHTFKVKIGRDPGRELAHYRDLLARLDAEETLRLDVNRAPIDPDLLAHFAHPRLEFVEEPFAELPEPRSLPVPVALDESVVRSPERARRWLEARALTALVLKPMTLGLSRTLAWIEAAHAVDLPVVISHCFDGSVAFTHYQALARAIGPQRFAMGLGRHPGLALWSQVHLEIAAEGAA